MAAPPNPPNFNSQKGSSQVNYPSAGFCSRCVRTCIKCHGTPQQSGIPPPTLNATAFQQQQHPITCQCSARLHTNSVHNAFLSPASIQVQRLAALASDQPTGGSLRYEQRIIQKMPLENFEREGGLAAKAVSEASYHPLLMGDKITEEATADDNTEKTSVLPSQRDSAPSTRQEASRLDRLEDEGAQREPQEEDVTETLPSQSNLILNESAKELRSVPMQADILRNQHNQSPPRMKDKIEGNGTLARGKSSYDSDERCTHREPNLNDCTAPESQPRGLGRSLDHALRRRQAEQASCQRVTDCLQKCFEKLEVIQQNAPDRNVSGNTLNGYYPQRRDSVDSNQSQVASTLITAASNQVTQTVFRYTPSQSWAEEEMNSSTDQNALKVAMVPGCPRPQVMICNCTAEQENMQSEASHQPTDALKSSASKLSLNTSLPVTSKQRVSEISGVLQSNSSGKKSAHFKEQPNTAESVASKQQHTSANSNPSQSHCSGKNLAVSKEKPSKMESQPLATEISGIQSNSTIIKCQVTGENLNLRKNVCEKLLDLADTGDSAQQKPEEIAARHSLAKQSELVIPSHSANTLQQQEREPTDFSKMEGMISQHGSILKTSASQQEGAPKMSTSPQESAIKISELAVDSGSESSLSRKQPLAQSSSQPSAQPSEIRARSVTRTQVSDKTLDLYSGQSEKQSQRPTAQPSKQSITISPEFQQLKTEEAVREMRGWISDVSKTSLPSEQKFGRDPMPQKADLLKSSVSALLPEEREILSAMKTLSEVEPSPQTSMTKPPMKEETQPRTPDSAKTPWQKQGKDKGLQQKPSKDKLKKKDEDNTVRVPPKGTYEVTTTMEEEPPPQTSDQKRRLSADGNQSSPGREQSSTSDQKSSSSSEKLDQTGGEKPQSCLLHAYYLPLYQCAYCQQVTPYPIACQMGVVACCPSPYDLCRCQPCYKCSSPPCLPCSCQGCPLPYLQPPFLEHNESDQTSRISPLQSCPQPVCPCPQSKPFYEAVSFQSNQPVSTDPIEPSSEEPKKRSPEKNDIDRKKSEKGYVETQLDDSSKPNASYQEPRFQPAAPCQQSCYQPPESYQKPCCLLAECYPPSNQHLDSELWKPFSQPKNKREVPRKNDATEKSKSIQTTKVENEPETNKTTKTSKMTKLEEESETNKAAKTSKTKLMLDSEQAEPCIEPNFQPTKQLWLQSCQQSCCQQVEPCQNPGCQLAELVPQLNRQRSFEPATSHLTPRKEHNGSTKNNDSKEKPKNNRGKAKLNEGSKPAQSCQQTSELCWHPCSEPTEKYPEGKEITCPHSCENVTCLTSASSLKYIESCPCQQFCQRYEQSCQASKRSGGRVGGSGGAGNRKRSSIESDQSGLNQLSNSNSIRGSVPLSGTKRESGKEETGGKIKGKDIEQSIFEKASSISEDTVSVRSKRKGRPEKENDANEKSKLDRGKDLNEGPHKKFDRNWKIGKDEGRNEAPRREAVYRKGTFGKDDNANPFPGKRGKFRRGKADYRLEEIKRKGSSTRAHRSPHRSASAESRSPVPSNTTISENGSSKKCRVSEGGGLTVRQANAKITRGTEKDDRRKRGLNFFEKTINGPTALYRGTGRALYQPSPPVQAFLSKTKLRKLHMAQLNKDTPPRTEKVLPQIDKAISGPPACPVSEGVIPEARGGGSRWLPLMFQDRSFRKQSSQYSQPFGRSVEGSGQKSIAGIKDSQIRTITPPYSHAPLMDADCASNKRPLRCSWRFPYPDREKQRNVFSPYYLTPTGAPHRAICSTRRSKLVKRDQLSDHNNVSKFSKPSQLKPSNLPSSSSSGASSCAEVKDSASNQSEIPNCLWQESQCTCAEWLKGASYAKYHNCCAHVWANAPHYVCPLHSHHLCPSANSHPARRRNTKTKLISLHSQRNRRILLRRKRHLEEQKPR